MAIISNWQFVFLPRLKLSSSGQKYVYKHALFLRNIRFQHSQTFVTTPMLPVFESQAFEATKCAWNSCRKIFLVHPFLMHVFPLYTWTLSTPLTSASLPSSESVAVQTERHRPFLKHKNLFVASFKNLKLCYHFQRFVHFFCCLKSKVFSNVLKPKFCGFICEV